MADGSDPHLAELAEALRNDQAAVERAQKARADMRTDEWLERVESQPNFEDERTRVLGEAE